MIRTYKCRCCLNCRFSDYSGREFEDTMICRYGDGHESHVRCDDTCAGWEPDDGNAVSDFNVPREDDVVKEYVMRMRAVVKGPEHFMRYADRIGEMLNEFLGNVTDGAEHDGYEVLFMKADDVRLMDEAERSGSDE